jgi:hypothetical protein
MRVTGADYGVSLSGHSHYTLAGSTPTTLSWSALSAVVDTGIAAGTWPDHPGDPTAEPIWLFVVPAGIAIDSFDAAHSAIALDGGHRILAYAHARTPPQTSDLEIAISHEVIEALTDPLVSSGPAWLGTGLFEAFSGAGEDEVADVCVDRYVEAGHTLATAWSNSQSLAGHSPCQPMAPGTFVGMQGPSGPLLAAPGSYFDVPLIAIGDDPTTAFGLTIVGAVGPLAPSLDRTIVHVGDTSHLTINVPPDVPGPYYLRIDSTVGTNLVSTWPIELVPY